MTEGLLDTVHELVAPARAFSLSTRVWPRPASGLPRSVSAQRPSRGEPIARRCSCVWRLASSSVAPSCNLAGGAVEGGEQRGVAIPSVVLGVPLRLTGAHEQHRLGAVPADDAWSAWSACSPWPGGEEMAKVKERKRRGGVRCPQQIPGMLMRFKGFHLTRSSNHSNHFATNTNFLNSTARRQIGAGLGDQGVAGSSPVSPSLAPQLLQRKGFGDIGSCQFRHYSGERTSSAPP